MKNKKTKQMLFLLSVGLLFLTSCAKLNDWFSTTKGSLIGNAYTIYQHDNEGGKTLEITGSSIDISAYEGEEDEEGNKTPTSVLDITIDGKQILAVGNTLIFEEKGIEKLMDYEEITEIYDTSLLRFIPFDETVNDLKNIMGKKRMVLIYSQLGQPLAVYEGDDVYVTIPKDLPKMTRINMDGKSLYLHRVNYTIIDSSLIK